MKLGRSDPCYCGSGKKYKHCCLNAGAVPVTAPADLTWRRLRALLNGYPSDMLRFITEAYGPLAVHEAWGSYSRSSSAVNAPHTPRTPHCTPASFHIRTLNTHAYGPVHK